jgi:hypothetical protein
MRYLILTLALSVTACSGSKGDNKSNQNVINNSVEETLKTEPHSNQVDTLNDPYHRSYLADKTTKEIGQMFLDNKLLPNDNGPTLRTMDSLLSTNQDSRKFYFMVFVKIMDKADGALAEAVGLPAMQYVEEYTDEFLDLSSNLSNEQFNSWARFVGWEILLSSNDNPVKDGELFIEKINSNCSVLDSSRKQRLENFNKIIYDYLREKIE